MKLQRFTAPTNQKAIAMIHQSLGPDALIYSTRSITNGVEILAGLPHSGDIATFNQTQAAAVEYSSFQEVDLSAVQSNMLEKITERLQLLDASVKELAKQFHDKFSQPIDQAPIDDQMKRNLIQYHLGKLGFSGTFTQKFVTNYLRSRKATDEINEKQVANALQKLIKTDSMEFVDGKNICALVGPTGVGKTTTIAKLAKRYINKYGSETLGFITTDYLDVTAKNHLAHYSRLFNVDLEYANNANELTSALDLMKDKNLILIDTYGVSQRDNMHVTSIIDLLENQEADISAYLTLPCNVQESVLDEIAKYFANKKMKGCILTKQDESINISSAVSVCINHKLNISYICNGQDINKNIEVADPEKIMSHILNETITQKNSEDVKPKTVSRVNRQLKVAKQTC